MEFLKCVNRYTNYKNNLNKMTLEKKLTLPANDNIKVIIDLELYSPNNKTLIKYIKRKVKVKNQAVNQAVV